MKTIDKIITPVSTKYGAPLGRQSVGEKPTNKRKKVFDCAVPMVGEGAYDRGGAYWGMPFPGKGNGQLRVSYTKDLTYINFYRK